jgi:ketosteroid isomerase-like protein
MKTKTNAQQLSMILIVIVLAVSLASCASAQPTDPIAIMQASNERLNAGDLDGFMKFFAEDAVMSDEYGRSVGAQAIREVMQTIVEQEVVKQGIRFDLSDLSADGNVVTYTFHVYMNNKEIDTYKGLDVIADGLIIFEGTEASLRSECDQDPSQAFCTNK